MTISVPKKARKDQKPLPQLETTTLQYKQEEVVKEATHNCSFTQNFIRMKDHKLLFTNGC